MFCIFWQTLFKKDLITLTIISKNSWGLLYDCPMTVKVNNRQSQGLREGGQEQSCHQWYQIPHQQLQKKLRELKLNIPADAVECVWGLQAPEGSLNNEQGQWVKHGSRQGVPFPLSYSAWAGALDKPPPSNFSTRLVCNLCAVGCLRWFHHLIPAKPSHCLVTSPHRKPIHPLCK